MRAKDGFVLRMMGDQAVVVSVGAATKIFNGMIKLNETGEYLWHHLEAGTTREEMVEGLLYKYEVSAEKAEIDVDEFIKPLLESGIVEE